MQVAYQLRSDELDINFLESVKALFNNKEIEIIIHDEEEEDKKLEKILNHTLQSSHKVSEAALLEALSED